MRIVAHQVGFHKMIGQNAGLIGGNIGGFKDISAKFSEGRVSNRWHRIDPFSQMGFGRATMALPFIREPKLAVQCLRCVL